MIKELGGHQSPICPCAWHFYRKGRRLAGPIATHVDVFLIVDIDVEAQGHTGMLIGSIGVSMVHVKKFQHLPGRTGEEANWGILMP